MTHRDQLGRTLCRHDPGDARHIQRMAFGVLRKRFDHRGFHCHKGTGLGLASGRRFAGNIDHPRATSTVVVGKFLRHTDVLSYMGCSPASPWCIRLALAKSTAASPQSILLPESARGPAEQRRNNLLAPWRQCRPIPATAPTRLPSGQTLPTGLPGEILLFRSSHVSPPSTARAET